MAVAVRYYYALDSKEIVAFLRRAVGRAMGIYTVHCTGLHAGAVALTVSLSLSFDAVFIFPQTFQFIYALLT